MESTEVRIIQNKGKESESFHLPFPYFIFNKYVILIFVNFNIVTFIFFF